MGLLSRLATILPRRIPATTKAADDSVFWSDGAWGGQSAAGPVVNQQSSLSASGVMACTTMLAEDVAKCTPRIYREDPDGGQVEAPDHYLHELLDQPNEWQNGFEFLEQMQMGLLLRGNGYAVIIRNPRGRPIRLVPVNPDLVSLWEATDGSLFYRVGANSLHLRAMLSGLPSLIPAEDMLHIRGFSIDGLLGASRISLAREAIGLSISQEQQAARWMKNSAKPSGMLTTEQKLTPDAADRLKADVRANWGGVQNSGKIIIGEQGLKFDKFSMTSADLEFIASRQFQLSEIARIFRVPPHMIGDLSRSTNSNIVQQSQEYVNYTISGYTRRWESKLSSAFSLRKEGVFVDFDMSELLRADIVARFGVYRTAIMSMVMTPDEARIDAGFKPKGGDAAKLQYPKNMGTGGSQSSGDAPDDAGDNTNKPAN